VETGGCDYAADTGRSVCDDDDDDESKRRLAYIYSRYKGRLHS